MSAALRHPPPRMTVAEFLDWDSGDRSGRRWQLVDGVPTAMAPANEDHGAIQGELARLIGNHLLARNLPCRAVTEPGIIPRLRADENWRIPDLGVTCAPARGTRNMEEPVLLVEILSPGNYAETRANLWTYITLPSLREILVVQSTRIEAEVMRLAADGTWPSQPLIVRDGEALELASIGFTEPLRAIYRTTSLVA